MSEPVDLEYRIPVIVEVGSVRTVIGWITDTKYLPDLLDMVAAEIRSLAQESEEVRHAITGH